MRRYGKGRKAVLEQVVCNQCGHMLQVENGILKEGCFHADAVFGYFSKNDGIRQSFDICESCYEKWIAGFTLPVQESQEKELL